MNIVVRRMHMEKEDMAKKEAEEDGSSEEEKAKKEDMPVRTMIKGNMSTLSIRIRRMLMEEQKEEAMRTMIKDTVITLGMRVSWRPLSALSFIFIRMACICEHRGRNGVAFHWLLRCSTMRKRTFSCAKLDVGITRSTYCTLAISGVL